jgi:hypothetical protein
VAFLVEELAAGQVYLLVLRSSSVSVIPKVASWPRFIHPVWSCVIFAVDSVIKAPKTLDIFFDK